MIKNCIEWESTLCVSPLQLAHIMVTICVWCRETSTCQLVVLVKCKTLQWSGSKWVVLNGPTRIELRRGKGAVLGQRHLTVKVQLKSRQAISSWGKMEETILEHWQRVATAEKRISYNGGENEWLWFAFWCHIANIVYNVKLWGWRH